MCREFYNEFIEPKTLQLRNIVYVPPGPPLGNFSSILGMRFEGKSTFVRPWE